MMAPEEPTAPAGRLVREKMWVERPAGAHLSQARTPGGYSSLARDDGTNELETHATLFPIVDDDEDEADSLTDSAPVFVYVTNEDASDSRAKEPSELEALLGALVLLGAIKAAEKLAPHAKRLWNDRALPAIKSTWNKLARTCRADSRAATDESATSIESASADSSQELIAALEEYRASMSSAEARERFVAALMARLFYEEQLRMLRNARIEDVDGPLELERAMETLTPKQVGDSIKLMLETNPSLVHEETLAGLGKILGSSRVDGGYVPLRNEKIKEALRLTDSEA